MVSSIYPIDRDNPGNMKMDPAIATLLLERAVVSAGRTALGDGLSREYVAEVLHSVANAIETQDCAEDMSPISIPME